MDGQLSGADPALGTQLLREGREKRKSQVTYASTSASFSERTDAAAVDKHRPVFRERKRNARLCSGNSVSYQSRSPVETRPEAPGMEAFQEMVLTSRPRFVTLAQAILRNREDAIDAVQNALLSGYLHLPSFEGRSALTTWFTRIVANPALIHHALRR
jgi:hypothetical protein